MNHILIPTACLLFATNAWGQETLSFGTLGCDNTEYVSLEPNMLSAKIVATWTGNNTRTLKRYLNGGVTNVVLATSGDTPWVHIPGIPLTPWSPVVAFELYDGNTLTAGPLYLMFPAPWRNGIDTLLMEVDETESSPTTLTTTTTIDLDFEQPFTYDGRGCTDHHLLSKKTYIGEEGDTLATHIADITAGDPLDFTYTHEGNAMEVCVYSELIHADVGPGAPDFLPYVVPVPHHTSMVCRMMADADVTTSVATTIDNRGEVSAYPNPCTDEIFIRLPFGETYNVFAADGRLIASGKIDGENHRLDTEIWSPGIYHLSSGGRNSTIVRQ